MVPEELKDTLKEQPFRPFRIVLTDGESYDIRHPDLLWVGKRTAWVGWTKWAQDELHDRAVKVDLLHIVRVEPLASSGRFKKDGKG
jgi:hypothetical protein